MVYERYDYPSVRVTDRCLYFNVFCEELTKQRKIQISKAGSLIIFRCTNAVNGFAWRRGGRTNRRGFEVRYTETLKYTRLQVGAHYRLFPYAGGLALDVTKPMGV